MLLGSSLATLVVPGCTPAPWPLLTREEARHANTAAAQIPQIAPATRAAPGGPQIVVEQPAVGAPLRPPVTFRVRFVPESGSSIDPHTFRATYGSLGLDITARLLQHAQFTGEKLIVDNVDIPAGSHMVTIEIGDTRGHESSRTFQFTVV
jgi:hypothetical protein